MSKRRLTDMLREEMQKPSEPEAEAAIEVTAEIVQDAPQTEVLEIKAEILHDAPASSPAKSRHSHHTKAELENIVGELNNSVQVAQQRESELLEQIDQLKAELVEKKQHISNLQEYLEQANQLKSELDKVKQECTDLGVANQALQAEIAQLKTNTPVKVEAAKKAEPAKPALQKVEAKRPPETPYHPHSTFRRPIGSNASLSRISNDNIGWVD